MKINRDEYIDRNGNVRKHSRSYYKRVRQLRIRLAIIGGVGIVVLFAIIFFIVRAAIGFGGSKSISDNESEVSENAISSALDENSSLELEDDSEETSEDEIQTEEENPLFFKGYECYEDERTRIISGDNVSSSYAVLVDLSDGHIVAEKSPDTVISPASMTKILTVLVAAEHINSLSDTVTITRAITDFTYQNDCSVVGFDVDETVTVTDLFYGTILPSGADAAIALAGYCAGSVDGFVELMNEKVEELGRSSTAHFTNPIGIYNEENHCTVKDMAMILKAAAENDICREALSRHVYTTTPTTQHPQGITVSNWFLRRIEDKDTHGLVVCAKTGFVAQSGNCAASYMESNDGGKYICVTGSAHSAWRCIYDHVAIYQQYTN